MADVYVELDSAGELSKVLKKVAARGVPYAARNALNACAFEARKGWIGEMGKKLVLRNNFTERSVRVEKATGNHLPTMKARTGSVTNYMGDQEDGGEVKGHGPHKPIPTTSAAGQGLKKRPRTRQVQGKNWLNALKVAARPAGNNRRYRNMLAVQAAAVGNGIAFLDLGRRKGLFRVTGRKRGLSIRMLWDLAKTRVHVKGTHTLESGLRVAAPRMAIATYRALYQQVERAVMGRGRRR